MKERQKMAINYDDFLKMNMEELQMSQDFIGKLIANHQQDFYADLLAMDTEKTIKNYGLNKKTDLPTDAWHHFFSHIKAQDILPENYSFLFLLSGLDSFVQYERHYANTYTNDQTICLSQEVIYNALASEDKTRLIMQDEKFKDTVNHWIIEENELLLTYFNISQDALDVLVEYNILNWDDSPMLAQLEGFTKSKVHLQPGLWSFYQHALINYYDNNANVSEEEWTHIVKEYWDVLPVEYIQKWHQLIGEPLCWEDLVNGFRRNPYNMNEKDTLEHIIPDSYGYLFGNKPENFQWLVNLPANDKAWQFVDNQIQGIAKGMVLAHFETFCPDFSIVFKNMSVFLNKMRDENEPLYEKLIATAKECNDTNSELKCETFSSTIRAIDLYEKLHNSLLSEDGKADTNIKTTSLKI